MTAFGIWWCEAYGPPPADHPNPDAWPRCFIHGDDGQRCSAPGICAHTMAAERHRVFARINELAVDGDETFADLAEHFSTPGQLLGGPDSPPNPDVPA